MPAFGGTVEVFLPHFQRPCRTAQAYLFQTLAGTCNKNILPSLCYIVLSRLAETPEC